MPSYRRRGILSSLMRRQIDDIHERGEPIAVLWASDARIYGRFGYGRASWHASFTVQGGEGVLSSQAPADPALRLRITEPQAALTELAKVYDTLLPTQPGFFVRSESWWNHIVEDPDEGRPGSAPVRCVLAEDDAGTRGYALYSGRGRWDEDTFLPDSTLDIRELVASRPVGDRLAVVRPAQPRPGQRGHGPAAARGRPTAAPDGRPAAGASPGQRRALGEDHRRASRPHRAALRGPG